MKRSLSIHVTLLACCLSSLLACTRDNAPRNPASPTMLEWISRQSDMTLLNAAIQRTHLDAVFSSGGPWTFFAPDDSAFLAAGLTMDVIKTYDTAALNRILEYHIVPGSINGNVLFNFFTERLQSLNPSYEPVIIKNYYGIFYNGIKVIDANLAVADGTVQVLDRVAFPPTGNILAVVQAQPDLTYTASFLNNTTTASQLLLNNQVNFLAPSDSAWKAYGFATIDQFNQADTNMIFTLLNPCIDQGPVFTPQWYGGGLIYGVGRYGRWYATVSADGLHILGTTNTPGNLTPPAIIHPDIVASNGVLDIIDQVYLYNQ